MPSPAPSRRDGCGFAFATGVFTCLFLIVNGVVVTSLYRAFFPEGPPNSLHLAKAMQMVLFIGPVALLFAEWTLIDGLIHRWYGRGKGRE